jgi:hypothetical protein
MSNVTGLLSHCDNETGGCAFVASLSVALQEMMTANFGCSDQ